MEAPKRQNKRVLALNWHILYGVNRGNEAYVYLKRLLRKYCQGFVAGKNQFLFVCKKECSKEDLYFVNLRSYFRPYISEKKKPPDRRLIFCLPLSRVLHKRYISHCETRRNISFEFEGGWGVCL